MCVIIIVSQLFVSLLPFIATYNLECSVLRFVIK